MRRGGECRVMLPLHFAMHLCRISQDAQQTSRILTMKGVQFLVDENGDKTAVLIDLKKHSELWEDFYDRALARDRENEPRESLESVKKRLQVRVK